MATTTIQSSLQPKPIADLTGALVNAGAHYVDVDQPSSDHPNWFEVSFSAFSRSEHRGTRHSSIECHLSEEDVSSFAVLRGNDCVHPSVHVISRGTNFNEMIRAAVAEVQEA